MVLCFLPVSSSHWSSRINTGERHRFPHKEGTRSHIVQYQRIVWKYPPYRDHALEQGRPHDHSPAFSFHDCENTLISVYQQGSYLSSGALWDQQLTASLSMQPLPKDQVCPTDWSHVHHVFSELLLDLCSRLQSSHLPPEKPLLPSFIDETTRVCSG